MTELKRGKGSQKQQNVAVKAEPSLRAQRSQSTLLKNIDTGKKSSHCRYFNVKVLLSHSSNAINECVKRNLSERTIVFTDKARTYSDIANLVEIHIMTKSNAHITNQTLEWVHIAISNAKRIVLGINHHVKGQYRQLCLNQFCFKLNRRYFQNELFDRLSLAVAHASGMQTDEHYKLAQK